MTSDAANADSPADWIRRNRHDIEEHLMNFGQVFRNDTDQVRRRQTKAVHG